MDNHLESTRPRSNVNCTSCGEDSGSDASNYSSMHLSPNVYIYIYIRYMLLEHRSLNCVGGLVQPLLPLLHVILLQLSSSVLCQEESMIIGLSTGSRQLSSSHGALFLLQQSFDGCRRSSLVIGITIELNKRAMQRQASIRD
jgi:hypothetical protein